MSALFFARRNMHTYCNTHSHTHKYANIYMHTYIDTYIHTYIQVRLDSNRVSNNKHAGLFVDGMESKAHVKECEIMSNGVRGIGVQSGAELQLFKSNIGRNAQEGVFVSGNRCVCACVRV